MDINDLQALMGESLETEDYRDLWVIDPDSPPPSGASLDGGGAGGGGLIGEARRMADSLGAYVHYIGGGSGEEAIAFGADRVHPLDLHSGDEIVSVLAAFFESRKPEFVFLSATPLGDEVAGRLAQRLGGGMVHDCIALRLDESTRELLGVHPVYDGAYYLDTAITRKPAIVTVRPGALAAPYRDAGRAGEIEPMEAAPTQNRVRALGEANYAKEAVPLSQASKVLAVGRSGNDEASIQIAKQLAEKIGAHFAGDRSAFDSGWIAREQIVGVVGTEIAPDVYIAAGIWGDTLHRVGVEGAKHVIAIHPNPNAPIFKYADACLVGQPKEVLPKLLALL